MIFLDLAAGLVAAVVLGVVVARWWIRVELREDSRRQMAAWLEVVPSHLFSVNGARLAYGDVREHLRAARELGMDPDTALRRLEIYASQREAALDRKADSLLEKARRAGKATSDGG